MNVLRLLAGPLIGSVIGYCTNYIAIKMLFRPRKAIMIGSFRVPFTPGIIPKEKKRIGIAIGEAVGSTLLTREDITETLLNDEMKSYVSSSLMEKLGQISRSEMSLKSQALEYISPLDYGYYKGRLEDMMTKKIVSAVQKIDFGTLISAEATKVVKEKMQGSMLGMFIDESTIQSFIEPVGAHVDEYVMEHGEELIAPRIQVEFDEVENQSFSQMLEGAEFDQERMAQMIEDIFERVVSNYATQMIEKLNIAKIIEEKIDAMDVMEVETLVLSVMDKELKAIVNLGALIGFILGIFNLLF